MSFKGCSVIIKNMVMRFKKKKKHGTKYTWTRIYKLENFI